MLPNFKNIIITGVAAATLAATSVVPAHAWDEREQDALKALAGAAILGAIIYQGRKGGQQRYDVPSRAYRSPQPSYTQPSYSRPAYQEPARYQAPPVQTYQSGIYSTPAAQAFNSYSATDRRRIQSRLAEWGYYHSSIDGAFGPNTYRAVTALAGDSQGTNQLTTYAGAYDFYSRLIR